jgi:hypothetical protein
MLTWIVGRPFPIEVELAIVAYLVIAVFLIARVMPQNDGVESPRRRRTVAIVFLLASLAVLLCGRWQILRYDLIINPDEAELAALAMLSHWGRSEQVRVTARLGGKAVAMQEIMLDRFPRWTYYQFDKAVTADALTIDLLSYGALGGGLNEVKAYRD